MKYPLFSTVILSRNLPEYGFRKGDVATIVEHIEKPNEDGYILEFFDANGDTLAVVPVVASVISKPYPNAIVNYRRLAKSA
jgi:Glu-tRNA(Gln) amidotransferase subunit E-like FAD-binding protein